MPEARPILVALALTLACAPAPSPPTPASAESSLPTHPALGPLPAPPALAAAFADTAHFSPLRTPGPDDWLSSHDEPGQTVPQFLARGPNKPTSERNIIYLQPIGPFSNHAPSLPTFERYTEAFFNLEVSLLDPVPVESLQATTRESDYGPQLRTGDVLTALERLLPEDGFLLVGLTMTDLYPGEDWNFVFGYASFDKRVSVYSLLRFDPLIDDTKPIDEELRRALILQRSLKVMTHELTHSFGIRHCVHYDCLMNGANHLGEVDIHPMHVCPVCLRKLHLATGLDPLDHYQRLGEFHGEHAMADEAAWTTARVDYLMASARTTASAR